MQKNISDYYSVLLETTWKKQVKNKENKQFVEDINNVLENYGVEERINHTHLIRIQTDKIDDLALSYFQTDAHNNRLAKIIEKFIWNTPETNTYLYHFTKEEYAKSIQSTNSLRLYNIYKRYNDGEIKDFLKDFKIPYQIDENYEDIFYCHLQELMLLAMTFRYK